MTMSSLGPSEEAFCALCGLPFFIHIANFRSTVTEDDLVWLSYFLARKRLTLEGVGVLFC